VRLSCRLIFVVDAAYRLLMGSGKRLLVRSGTLRRHGV